MDEADESATWAGGVNTVAVGADGRLRGYSTDGPGLARAVREQLGVELRDVRVLILVPGAAPGGPWPRNGAQEGCPRLALTNRTVEKLSELVALLGGIYPRDQLSGSSMDTETLRAELAETDLIVNCSALGMSPNDPSPISPSLLDRRHLLYDTIYTARRTPLMLAGDTVGARSANGMSMLLHQGALSFEIWFQRPAPLEVMREALRQHTV